MIKPEILVDGLSHPYTGRFLHEPTMQYVYFWKGVKIAECDPLNISKDERLGIDRAIWGKFFGGING